MAAKTWSRTTGDANWSTAANWNGGTVPVTTDAITFNGTSVLDCTIDALGTWSGGTITVAGTYSGNITQNVNMTAAAMAFAGALADTWTQAANFTCTTFSLTGTNSIAGSPVTNYLVSGSRTFQCTTFTVISGSINLGSTSSCICTGLVTINATVGPVAASTVIAPAGTWETRAGWSQSGTGADSIDFQGNGGTVLLASNSAQTINVPSITFNLCAINKSGGNVVISNGTTFPLGASPTTTNSTSNSLTVTGTVTVSGHWTHVGALTISASTGVVSGSLTDLTFGDNLTINSTATFPTGVKLHVVNGGSASVITATATTFGTSTILKTANGGCTIANGTTLPLGASPTTSTTGFAVTVTGTLTVSGTWTHTGDITVSATTGVVSGGITACSFSGSLTISSSGTWPSGVVMTSTGTIAIAIDATAAVFGQFIFNRNTGSAVTISVSAGTDIPLGTDPTFSVGTGAFTFSGNLDASGTVTYTGGAMTFGASTVVTGTFTWKHQSDSNFTLNAATTWAVTAGYTANIGTANARTFAGAGKTFASFSRIGSGSGTLTITGANTFTNFTDNLGVVAHTLRFPAATTTTFTNPPSLAGSSGKLLTIDSSSAGSEAVFTTTGTANVSADYLSLKDNRADASPLWFAGANTTIVSNVSNWIYSAPYADPADVVPTFDFDHLYAEVTSAVTHTGDTAYTDVTGAAIAAGGGANQFIEGHKYFIMVQAQVGISGSETCGMRVLHGATVFPGSTMEYEGGADNYNNYSFPMVWTAAAGEGVKVQHMTKSGAQTVTSNFLTIFALDLTPLTDGVDYSFNEVAADTALTTTWSSSNNSTVTLTPTYNLAEWLVVTFSRIAGSSASSNAESRMTRSGEAASTSPLASQEPQDTANLDTPTFCLMRAFKLGEVSNTFTEQSRNDTASAHTRKYSSTFVLNISRFPRRAYAWTQGPVTISTRQAVTPYANQAQTLTFDPGAKPTWIFSSVNYYFPIVDDQIYVRLQVANADAPAGQTTAGYKRISASDATNIEPVQNQVVLTPSAGAVAIDVDAGRDESGNAAVNERFIVALALRKTPPVTGQNLHAIERGLYKRGLHQIMEGAA